MSISAFLFSGRVMGQRKQVEFHMRTSRGWGKVSEAARYMSVSKKQVYIWLKSGELPFTTLENGEHRVSYDDIDLFLLNRRGKPVDPTLEQVADELTEGL